MPVPTQISDLSTTAASNSPAGSDNTFPDLDNYLRAHAKFIADLRDGNGSAAEVSVASGATTGIGAAASPFVRITGTTTITSFGTNYTGAKFIRFAGALTLTHNATTLILPGAANITTVAGDTCIATPYASGWIVSSFARMSYAPPNSGTYTPTLTNTTNIDSSTASSATRWTRVGNFVFVSGQLVIDPNSASALTTLYISLPISSTISGASSLSGLASRADSSSSVLSAYIQGETVGNQAQLNFYNDGLVSSRTWVFSFSYLVA